MNKIVETIITAWHNKHTSFAAIAYCACKLGEVWLPQYHTQFQATEALAVGWGLLKAGDAVPVKTAPPTLTLNPDGTLKDDGVNTPVAQKPIVG